MGSDLRAWLFTIMHNVFASQVRPRAAARALVDIDDVAHELRSVDSGSATRRIDLQRCLLLLPEDQRAVLLLVALEDLSYAAGRQGAGHPGRAP